MTDSTMNPDQPKDPNQVEDTNQVATPSGIGDFDQAEAGSVSPPEAGEESVGIPAAPGEGAEADMEFAAAPGESAETAMEFGEAPGAPRGRRRDWARPGRWGYAAALALVVILGGALRLQGPDWDAGHHLHPDERFLTMVEGSLALPQDLLGYFDTDTSPLNPRNGSNKFFVYGTWPIILVHTIARRLESITPPPPADLAVAAGPRELALKGLAWLSTGSTEWPGAFIDYGRANLVGRRVVGLLDTLAILALFALGTRLYDRRVGLLAATLGAFTAFFIQQSHFFTVDAPANLFVLVSLVGLAGVAKRGRWSDAVLGGAGMGFALASKISVWPLVPLAVVAAVAVAWSAGGARNLMGKWLRAALLIAVIGVTAFAGLRFAQPDMWAGPGWPNVEANPDRLSEVTSGTPNWWHTIRDVLPAGVEPLLLPDPRWAANMQQIQGQITGHGMDWPPNHQWFGRPAYLFPWKNMVLWGMGIFLGLAATVGWAAAGLALARGDRRHLVPWLWVSTSFAYLGIQWAKTMRYYLPLYPALIVLAAWALIAWLDHSRRRSGGGRGWRAALGGPRVAAAGIGVVVIGTVVWGLMVAGIYQRDHSRVAGTRWIYHHVPAGLSLHVADTSRSAERDWEYIPVQVPASVSFDASAADAGLAADAAARGVGPHTYVLATDATLDASRILTAADSPIAVDALQIANASDPLADAGPETFRVEIVDNPYPTSADVLTSGVLEANLTDEPTDLVVPFPSVELAPDGEYYLVISVEGAPIHGRLPILGLETSWDDVIPLSMDGYAPFDDAKTPWGDGMYGSRMLELFGEDEEAKVADLVAGLATSDYIVPTSNRVYGSIRQLPTRYPMTIRYYDKLFAGSLGFDAIASITSYPGLGPVRVPDQSAEEAWHVYDHPKVDVFKRNDTFDPEVLRAELLPLTSPSIRTWVWPSDEGGILGSLMGRLGGFKPNAGVGAAPEQPRPLADVMLSADRFAAQRDAASWRDVFDPSSAINRQPALAALLWYVVLLGLGVLAFPIVALALGDLADRGWAVSRTAGLLLVSWMAWVAASTGRVPHTPWLLWLAVGVLALAGLACLRRAGRNRDLIHWARTHLRIIAVEEAVFLALFAFFVLVRVGNPDLWHPWYGGEKPMDLAYFNAVLRTESFPPYDPWFAGGKLNYYYFGFVLVGALTELTRVVPWIAYNLSIPTLAALTGTGVFGVSFAWSSRFGRSFRTAVGGGIFGAILAVAAGNLFQVQMIAKQLATFGTARLPSAIPGFESVQRVVSGWWSVARHEAELGFPTGHWYWNASRAIPAGDEVQPITEFPFFTFLYADLHAHMMALPLTVLALAVALSWTMSWSWRWNGFEVARGATRFFLAALTIGALWPANTWDFPTYGLVVAGALAVAHWGRRPRIDLPWLLAVGIKGLALLGLSLLLYLPYHLAYVQPYGDFGRWTGARTPLSAYLTVHGIALFALGTWAAWRALAASELEARLPHGGRRVAAIFLIVGLGGAALAAGDEWTVIAASAVGAGGALMLLRRGALPHDRFAGWLLLLGAALTMFVEFVVLQGDIGRMNTVFKFYIQVWVLWAALAGVALAWIAPHIARRRWANLWWGTAAVLMACGLVYTVTATRGKWTDRFPVMTGMNEAERAVYDRNWVPGLSGVAYEEYAQYDDDGHNLTLRYDADGIRWMQDNVRGTPVILEGFRDKGYRWGSRYSIHTGLPDVIGWDWHQIQQRNAVGSGVVTQRTADVGEMFNTTDVARARELMDRYWVEYVIVGEMEHAFYAPEGLAKFDLMVDEGEAELVYRHPEGPLVIYRIPRSAPKGIVPGLDLETSP